MASWLKKKIPLRRALATIIMATVLVSGTAASVLFYFRYQREKRAQDEHYLVVAIVQSTPDHVLLPTDYLAELLDLSVDKPTNLYRFNARNAKKALLASPLIKEAEVKKITPGTLYIDYCIRTPVAFLGDYRNAALDHEGYLIPFKPFFTPKKLPEVRVGAAQAPKAFGVQVEGPEAELALRLLDMFSAYCNEEGISLLKVDVSQAFAPSYGQRQIVLTLEDQIEKENRGRQTLCLWPTILRMDAKHYENNWRDYLLLRTQMHKSLKAMIHDGEHPIVTMSTVVVDLRVPSVALIKKMKF